MRIENHPILGRLEDVPWIEIEVDGQKIRVRQGEMIASALIASGMKVFRRTSRRKEARSYYCGIGQCTDCMMEVDGVPGVRTCITPVKEGMRIRTQAGLGEWGR